MTRFRMRSREETGSGTVLGIALMALLILVTTAAVAVAALVLTHRRAESAADLAALAGAHALPLGSDPCAAAQSVARRNGAAFVSCWVRGPDVLVVTRVAGPTIVGRLMLLTGRARAGPVR